MRPFYILSGFILLLFSCNENNNCSNWESCGTNTITIGINKSIYNSDKSASITMDSVLSESRCPENANCFWEGNAAVRFVFKNEFVDTSFVLNTSGIDPLGNSFTINAIQIKLIKLMPYPATPDPIDYRTYRSEIVIED